MVLKYNHSHYMVQIYFRTIGFAHTPPFLCWLLTSSVLVSLFFPIFSAKLLLHSVYPKPELLFLFTVLSSILTLKTAAAIDIRYMLHLSDEYGVQIVGLHVVLFQFQKRR